jgi:hypothetical protein
VLLAARSVAAAVSSLARFPLLEAGVDVPRPGSHRLPHAAVQRLVDATLDLNTIGDVVGHRSAQVAGLAKLVMSGQA